MRSIEVPEEIDERLDALASETGRSKTSHALEAILEYLGDVEDLRVAETRLAGIRSGSREVVPIEALLKVYGLAD